MARATFNPDALTELVELETSGSPGLILNLIADFNASSREMITDIERAWNTANWELLERSAHSLKSSASLLGLEKLASSAFEIEEAAGKSCLPAINLDDLKVLYTDALSEINTFASTRS